MQFFTNMYIGFQDWMSLNWHKPKALCYASITPLSIANGGETYQTGALLWLTNAPFK